MRGNVNTIGEILKKHDFRFSKSKGQNFLIDANIPEKIVRLSGINETNCVLEVGPGLGALTSELCKAAGYVVAAELDMRLIPILSEMFSDRANVEIVQANILKMDIGGFFAEKAKKFRPCVCANLPYNITTPALTKLINTGIFEFITVMVQREVAGRMIAGQGSSEYGAFSVFTNFYSEPRILFDVPPECFMPKPKVHSSVVMLEMRSTRLLPCENEGEFFKVVRAAFGQRRKTLVNALYAVFGPAKTKEDIAGIVVECGFDVNVRGEELSPEDFARLSQMFFR